MTAMANTQSVVHRAAAHPTVRQFLRFAIVGAIATAVHYSVLVGLVELAGLNAVAATTIGFSVGAVVSYVLNRKVTFDSDQPHGIAFAKYATVLAVGLAINGAIVAGLLYVGVYYLIAQPIATGLVLFWNFGASRLLVFRD